MIKPIRFARVLPSFRRLLLMSTMLFLILCVDLASSWSVVPPSTAFALAFHNANPQIAAPAWLSQLSGKSRKPNLAKSTSPSKLSAGSDATRHAWKVTMKPGRMGLSNSAQRFVSSDGQLEVDLLANSLDVDQLARIPGGLRLYITQVKPGSGNTTSGQIFFGTYEFQFFNGTGKPVAGVQLLHPLALHFHLRPDQQHLVWPGQKVYAFWSAAKGSSAPPTIASPSTSQTPTAAQTGIVPQAATTQAPTLLYAQSSQQGMDWSVQSSFAPSTGTAASASAQSAASPGVFAVQASSVTFGTQAPQATWGKPADFQVGLSSGGLNYSYPLAIPPGPGGFQPSLALAYSSGSINEAHGWQSTSPWVGEGWSMDLGSISWGQENVTPNGTATLENVWHISDPSGISGQLIPPDLTYSTTPTYNPSSPTTSEVWHTAPESHAKVIEQMFGGQPCWRVYLPSGIMEEFGCTSDSRQSYGDPASGNVVNWRWDLDLLIDRFGNQVQVSYQRLHISSGYVRDAVLSDITYDDPTCHNTTTACSTWNPQVDIHFDANQSVTNLLNGGCGSGTSGQYRCDAPADLSGSGGLPVPKVLNSYVLNDVKVEVQGNILHEYVFSYNQGGPQTITDPNTGQSESIAGYLTLGEIQEEGTGGSSLNAPVTTITYTKQAEHYADLFSYATPTTNCSPYSNAPRDGSASGPCYLWSQSYNAYYISTLDNGRGWNEHITWEEAHSNTWGTDSGSGYNDVFACSSSQTSTNVCGKADDKNWSRIVVQKRVANSNGVSSTWQYGYYLQTGLGANFPGHSAITCSGSCTQHPADTWGNQNDDDDADYYNGAFESFQQVQVTLPDGSSQTDTYGATNGWGLYSSSITCFTGGTCVSAPYNSSSGPVLAGKQLSEQDYDSSGNLLKQITWSYATNCPPPGVAGSINAAGGSSDPGASKLFSELDHNNPVLVCDPRASQQDTYLTDGVTSSLSDPRVVHTTTTFTYDSSECGSYASGYDYGNLSEQDETANDVSGTQKALTLFCLHDNVGSSGTFLTDLPVKTQMQDASGTSYGCHVTFYGGESSYTSAPPNPSVTRKEDHIGYSAPSNGCAAPGGLSVTLHTYDASGNPITATDPDMHLGCVSGSSQYSACATYDATYQAHLVTAVNAKNQSIVYAYDSSVNGGYGQWLTGETDPNGQTTTYQYDGLGRLVGIVHPGDSPASPTITYTYINTCTTGGIAPCLELDTATTFTSGGPASMQKQWYDGWGHLVETQASSPNAGKTIVTYRMYDALGHETIKSLPYAVTTPPDYIAPDLTQARAVTAYDALSRSLGSVSYSDATTIAQSSSLSYTVAQGVSALTGESSTPYEQTITQDAYGHQSITYTDGLGRTRYTQLFTGTSSPYSVVRTVGMIYDLLGDTTSVTTYDSSGTVQASYTASYDGMKELVGFNDSDLGSCGNTPMPASCSSSTDTAWKTVYDADGNQLSQVDPRNQGIYTTYDTLDRPLCRAMTTADAASCGGSTDTIFFYDGYSNASTPGATFPSGCVAPGGSYASDPVGHKTAEIFIGTSGAGSGWRCYGYDARGKTDQSTLSVTTPDAGSVTQTVHMTYNDGGEITEQVYPDGETLTSTYDGNGHLQAIYFGTPGSTDPVSFLVGQMYYTDAGQVAGLAVGGSGPKANIPTPIYTTATTYDGLQRPLSTTITEGSQTVWSQTRTYDKVGNVQGLSTVIPTQGGSASENEAFCYDALSRLVWAGNSGTPTGGDHCMAPPTGTTLPTYAQLYSYDSLDRITGGPAGIYTYGDASRVHAVTNVGSVPNQYAAYDAMGNMVCRNTDATTGHTCAGSSPTGAVMVYDASGQLTGWTAPSGTVGSAHYLYDAEGNRVLANSSNAGTTTDTIYFDGYTETVLAGGATTTTTYYNANGSRVAVRVGGSSLDYLMGDLLGSNSVALNSTGQVIAFRHDSPYGTGDYTWGTMPTSYSYAGERLDNQTGLLYDNFRYYDPVIGRFVRSDNVQDNSSGMDPYAYVGDNPETRNDPSGHCWPVCFITAAIGAVAGAVVGVVGEAAQHGTDFGHYNWGHVAVDTGVGAVAGFMIGTGVGAAVGIGMIAGGVSSGIGVAAGVANHQHITFASGLQSIFEGATIGGIMGGLTAGIGEGLGLGARQLFQSASQGVGRALLQGGIQAIGGSGGDVFLQAWNSWWDGNPPTQSLDIGQVIAAGAISFGAGFLGQWAYNHVPFFPTGATYASRMARQAARDANWSAQDIWANSVSGAIQGAVQFVEVSAQNQPSSLYDGPREGHAF